MSTTDTYPPAGWRRGGDRRDDRPSLPAQAWAGVRAAVGWLDDHGRGAWIATTVAAFFVAPPLGVALLLFSIGTGRMFSSRHKHDRAMACGWGRGDGSRRDAKMARMRQARMAMRPSGNYAFDAYKADTLRRLEEEQAQFEEFLGRLREAKDKAEFDQFMDERGRRAADRTEGSDERRGDDEAA